MDMTFQKYRVALIGVAVALVALASSIVIIPETQQGVVIRTGQPVRIFNMFKPDDLSFTFYAPIWPPPTHTGF